MKCAFSIRKWVWSTWRLCMCSCFSLLQHTIAPATGFWLKPYLYYLEEGKLEVQRNIWGSLQNPLILSWVKGQGLLVPVLNRPCCHQLGVWLRTGMSSLLCWPVKRAAGAMAWSSALCLLRGQSSIWCNVEHTKKGMVWWYGWADLGPRSHYWECLAATWFLICRFAGFF